MYPPFEKLVTNLDLEINRLSADEIEAHPKGDSARWSIRQIVEHLVLTYRLSGANLQDRLRKARATKYRATWTQVSTRFVVLKVGYFPPGRLAPAAVTPSAEPAERRDGIQLAAFFASELEAMDSTLSACEVHFGGRVFATHQVLGPLSAVQWRRFHVIHAHHHLRHIHKLIQKLDWVMARN